MNAPVIWLEKVQLSEGDVYFFLLLDSYPIIEVWQRRKRKSVMEGMVFEWMVGGNVPI
jgi:hypothetical protein